MKITKQLRYSPYSLTISKDCFEIDITNDEVEIVCDWDYGWYGSGSERITIPLKILEDVILEVKKNMKSSEL